MRFLATAKVEVFFGKSKSDEFASCLKIYLSITVTLKEELSISLLLL